MEEKANYKSSIMSISEPEMNDETPSPVTKKRSSQSRKVPAPSPPKIGSPDHPNQWLRPHDESMTWQSPDRNNARYNKKEDRRERPARLGSREHPNPYLREKVYESY